VNEFTRTALGIVGSLALVGTAAGVTYGVASIVEDGSGEAEPWAQVATVTPSEGAPSSSTPESSSPTPVFHTGGLLRSSNRDHLAVCIDTSNIRNTPDVEASALSDIEMAFSQVRQHPLWGGIASPELAARSPEFTSGCPATPAFYDKDAGPWDPDDERVTENRGRRVEQPSPYLFHVYVLPEEEIFRIVGPSGNLHSGTEEVICDHDLCFPVTAGLYFSSTELQDTASVAREIEDLIGLR
jgi:hypothetical protein